MEKEHTPQYVRELPKATVKIFVAKSPRSPWRGRSLKRLVLITRRSYRTAYGAQAPLLDAYDEKAWIYLAVSTYRSRERVFKEVLTLRLVETWGAPHLTDELNFYTYTRQPEISVPELFGRLVPSLNDLSHVEGCYSQSRLGAMRPVAEDGMRLNGNRHIGVAWCSMIAEFLNAIDRAQLPGHVLFSQSPSRVQALCGRLPCERMDTWLGLPPGTIVLNRQRADLRSLIYQIPTYFLNLGDLAQLLGRLLAQEKLDRGVLQGVVKNGVTLEHALKRPTAELFPRLSELFSCSIPTGDGRIGGQELRRLADQEVGDGPVLRVTPFRSARAEIRNWEHEHSGLGRAPKAAIDDSRSFNERFTASRSFQ